MAKKNAAVTKIYKISKNNPTMWTSRFDCKQSIEKNQPYSGGFWFDNIESKSAKKNVVDWQHFSGQHQMVKPAGVIGKSISSFSYTFWF